MIYAVTVLVDLTDVSETSTEAMADRIVHHAMRDTHTVGNVYHGVRFEGYEVKSTKFVRKGSL